MNAQNEKCVLILDEQLPSGILANTAAILGITLGKMLPHVVGETVSDCDGNRHLGIIEFPVPVLKSTSGKIKEIRELLYDTNYSDVTVVDFTDLAQGCRTYDEFIGKMEQAPGASLEYLGLAVCGPKKKINKLTGNMPLLR